MKQRKEFNKLIDNHERVISYLRLAITDRCNLRCRYCMPKDGVNFVPHSEILSYEELLHLARIFTSLGIRKVRVTGGEPFARRDCVSFLQNLKSIKGLEGLYATTNGVVTAKYLDALYQIGISGINLSLDTLASHYFKELTGSDQFDGVMETLYGCLERSIPLKINTVVFEETSNETIETIADLARKYPLTVRFIEKMPFSGQNGIKQTGNGHLLNRLKGIFELHEIENDQPSTARVFELPGFVGKIGVIQGHSRQFCSNCNKLRITPLGILKTCLYDNGVIDLKKMLRSGVSDNEIRNAVKESVGKRFVNGLVAENQCGRSVEPSMASIGG